MSRQPPTFEQWIADTGRFGGSRREYQRIYGEDEGEEMSRIDNKLKGYLTISRWSGMEDEKRNITIRVIDEASGIEFICVSISPAELGLSITGAGRTDCEYTVNNIQNIGKTAESKSALVPYAKKGSRNHDAKALAGMEVDGWKARQSDLKNHHCWEESGIRVVFQRLVGEGVLGKIKP